MFDVIRSIDDIGGRVEDTIFVAGVGRSGTTWLAELISHNNEARIIFEPFLPNKVQELGTFDYYQYIRPNDPAPKHKELVRKVLTGRIRNNWSDRYNRVSSPSTRVVKEIRCNLMLKWLRCHFPEMPIVLLIRHPMAVVSSWLRLGWGIEAAGTRSDLAILTDNQQLQQDFLLEFAPILSTCTTAISRHLAIWCILNLVPLRQLAKDYVHIAFYETICAEPAKALKELFDYVGRPYDSKVLEKISIPSSQTNRWDVGHILSRQGLIDGWRNAFSEAQILRAREILVAFGMYGLYGDKLLPNPSFIAPIQGS